MGLLSEDRKDEGLAQSMSLADNLTLSRLPRGLISPKKLRSIVRQWISRLGIRTSGPAQSIADLSGGNQQKVALARLLHHDVDCLLLDEPTRGIDIASKADIYHLIDQLATQGKAILLVSSYLPELLGICDRIAVMYRGHLGPARPVDKCSEHSLMLEGHRTGGRTVTHLSRFAPLLGLFAVYGLFAILGPDSFSSGRNLETIARQTAIVGTAALGMTLVIIAGGIDLSVGSIIALTTVTIAASLQAGLSPLFAAFIGILTGALCGLVNGLIITRFRVVPFIVTLGTLLLLRGIAKGLAGEQKIDAPLTYLIDLLAALPRGAWWIFPPGVWLLIILAIVTGGFLAYTRPGKHIVAIGSNENTAPPVRYPRRSHQITRLCPRRHIRRHSRAPPIFSPHRGRSHSRRWPRTRRHRSSCHRRGQPLGRRRLSARQRGRRTDHDRHPLWLFTNGLAKLGARNRHWHYHRHRRGSR